MVNPMLTQIIESLLCWVDILEKSTSSDQQLHALNFRNNLLPQLIKITIPYNDVEVGSFIICCFFGNKEHGYFVDFWCVLIDEELFFAFENEAKNGESFSNEG